MKNTLVCIPYAGGSSAIFNVLKKDLVDITLKSIDLSGKGRRITEEPCSNFNDAIIDCVNCILSIGNYSSLSLFGYSMGGLLVYESVKYILNKFNILPKTIFIAACEPPSFNDSREKISTYSDMALCDYLIKTGGIERELVDSDDFCEFFLPIIRRDFIILDSYNQSSLPTRLPIVLNILYSEDEKCILDWDKFCEYSCKYTFFEGGHFFLNNSGKEICNYIMKTLIS